MKKTKCQHYYGHNDQCHDCGKKKPKKECDGSEISLARYKPLLTIVKKYYVNPRRVTPMAKKKVKAKKKK